MMLRRRRSSATGAERKAQETRPETPSTPSSWLKNEFTMYKTVSCFQEVDATQHHRAVDGTRTRKSSRWQRDALPIELLPRLGAVLRVSVSTKTRQVRFRHLACLIYAHPAH